MAQKETSMTLETFAVIHKSILNGIVPLPRKIIQHDGTLEIENIKTISASDALVDDRDELVKVFNYYDIKLQVIDFDEQSDVRLTLDTAIEKEGWGIDITPDGIIIAGGDIAGLFYAVRAMKQIITLAVRGDNKPAVIPCGTISDAPCYSWRGILLDCVRHFQPKQTVLDVIKMLSEWRINVFHWHISDTEGYRLPSEIVPESPGGCYSYNDIKEILAYAKKRHVMIIPELDMPGHSNYIVRHFPHLACNLENLGAEYCIGNPETKEFLKTLLLEVMQLFPDSPFIHIGGDEASTVSWKQCPKCQSALREINGKDIRQLEAVFMNEMAQFVISQNKQPIVWYTETVYRPEVIVQGWTSCHDIMNTEPHGNKMINSIATSFYLDMPATTHEPKFTWMPLLTEKTLYESAAPVVRNTELVMGVEACLWTEKVPHWRVEEKILSRIAGLSEVAWSDPEMKDWDHFKRRKSQLKAAGYNTLLRKM